MASSKYRLLIVDDNSLFWKAELNELKLHGVLKDLPNLIDLDCEKFNHFSDTLELLQVFVADNSDAATSLIKDKLNKGELFDICLIDVNLQETATKINMDKQLAKGAGLVIWQEQLKASKHMAKESLPLVVLYTKNEDVLDEKTSPLSYLVVRKSSEPVIAEALSKFANPFILEFSEKSEEADKLDIITYMQNFTYKQSNALLSLYLGERNSIQQNLLHLSTEWKQQTWAMLIETTIGKSLFKLMYPFDVGAVNVSTNEEEKKKLAFELYFAIFKDFRTILYKIVQFWEMDYFDTTISCIFFKKYKQKALDHIFTLNASGKLAIQWDDIAIEITNELDKQFNGITNHHRNIYEELWKWLERERKYDINQSEKERQEENNKKLVGLLTFGTKVVECRDFAIEDFSLADNRVSAITSRNLYIWPDDWYRIMIVIDANTKKYGDLNNPQFIRLVKPKNGNNNLIIEYKTSSTPMTPFEFQNAFANALCPFTTEEMTKQLPGLREIVCRYYSGKVEIVDSNFHNENNKIVMYSPDPSPDSVKIEKERLSESFVGTFYRLVFPVVEKIS